MISNKNQLNFNYRLFKMLEVLNLLKTMEDYLPFYSKIKLK